MEKILEKASELGHLLKDNEIVKRYRELAESVNKDEEAKALLDELIHASQAFDEKEKGQAPIEPEEKKRLADLQEKVKIHGVLSEFLATQAYYINLLTQVNEAIANPQGEPPKDSNIILPGDDKGIIIT